MANIGIGANGTLTLDFEDTFGVTPTPAGKKIPFESESFKGTQALMDNPVRLSDPNPADATVGRQDAGGSFSTVPTIETAPWLAKWALGSLNTVGAADPYTHTAKLVTGALPSVVAEVLADLDTDQFKLVNGATVNSFKFDVGVDGFLKWTFDTKAKKVTWSASAALAAGVTDMTTAQTFLDHSMLASADVKEGGSAIGTIVSMSCSVDHNLFADDYRVGGGGFRNSLVRRRAKVSGSVRIAFEDLVTMNKALAGTFTSFDLTWTAGTNRTLQVLIPRVRLERTDAAIDNDGPLFLDMNWTASKDVTEQTSIKIVVKNNKAGTVYA